MMNKEDTKKAIEIMQAFADGKTIETRFRQDDPLRTFIACPSPTWDFLTYEYRIKAPMPDSIDWSHVHEKFKFMARNKEGRVFLYEERPTTEKQFPFREDEWHYSYGPERSMPLPLVINAKNFSSFKQGDVPWDESLVERPKTKKYVVETVLGYD